MRCAVLGLAALAFVIALPGLAGAQGGPAGSPHAPFASGKKLTTEEALLQAPKDDPSLVPLARSVAVAGAVLKKSPKDPKAKKSFVDVGYKYAHTLMMDREHLKPAVQYRAALAMYRHVLKVDPNHQPSISEKKTIEDIYQTMPGGIPK